jgi:hypothetical protein
VHRAGREISVQSVNARGRGGVDLDE